MIVRRAFPRTEWRRGDLATALARGASAWNSLWSIWCFAGIPEPVSIMAQERAEWGWRHRLALMLAAPLAAGLAALALLVHVGFAALAPIAWALAYAVADQVPAFQRRIEFFGHAVSVVVAERMYPGGRDQFEAQHVRSILDGGYDQFRGWTWPQALIGLRGQYPAAERWANQRRALLDSYARDVERMKSGG